MKLAFAIVCIMACYVLAYFAVVWSWDSDK